MTTITETNITQQLDLSQFQIVLPEETIQIVEYPTTADFPGIGKDKRLYIALDSGLAHRWNGTAPTGTAESSTGWTITRMTTDADGVVTASATATGAWSNRASLSYT